jgi:hypothetical protein
LGSKFAFALARDGRARGVLAHAGAPEASAPGALRGCGASRDAQAARETATGASAGLAPLHGSAAMACTWGGIVYGIVRDVVKARRGAPAT